MEHQILPEVPMAQEGGATSRTLFVYMCCPITGNLETTLSKESFIKMCVLNQRKSITQWGNVDMSTREPCTYCELGVLIKNKKSFKAPKGVTFTDLKGNLYAKYNSSSV